MDVFWVASYRFFIGHCQPVASGGGDRYPDFQTDQAGGCQPDDAIGRVADICLGPEFFPMAYEWWRSGVYFLDSTSYQLANTSGSSADSGQW